MIGEERCYLLVTLMSTLYTAEMLLTPEKRDGGEDEGEKNEWGDG